MSYSRWKDPRFWPRFRDAFLRTHPSVTESSLEAAREYNSKRYYYQGIGHYEPEDAYARGVADLNHVYFEKGSFSFSGSRRALTQRRSAVTKGSWFRRASKSPARRVRSSAWASQSGPVTPSRSQRQSSSTGIRSGL